MRNAMVFLAVFALTLAGCTTPNMKHEGDGWSYNGGGMDSNSVESYGRARVADKDAGTRTLIAQTQLEQTRLVAAGQIATLETEKAYYAALANRLTTGNPQISELLVQRRKLLDQLITADDNGPNGVREEIARQLAQNALMLQTLSVPQFGGINTFGGVGGGMYPGGGSLGMMLPGTTLPQGIRLDHPGVGVVRNRTGSYVLRVVLDGYGQFDIPPGAESRPVYIPIGTAVQLTVAAFDTATGTAVGKTYYETLRIDPSRGRTSDGWGWDRGFGDRSFF